MSDLRLRQLQRLGIDIWLTSNQAEALIAAGEGQSLVAGSPQPASQETLRNRSWDTKRESRGDVRRSSRQEAPKPQTDQAHDRMREQKARVRVVENTEASSFRVDLFVYLFDTAALVLDKSTQISERLLHDLLFALNDFQIHPKYAEKELKFVNRFEFQYPVAGVSLTGTTSVEGAQEGFHAWFSKSTQKCNVLLTIGVDSATTVEKVSNVRRLRIDQADLLKNTDTKLKLWDEIQRVST